MLIADPDAGQNMTEQARSVLRHIDGVVTENSEPLKSLIANINTFSGALAKNTDRVDGIMSGFERMTGGAKKSTAHVYDLAAPRDFPGITKIPPGQLVIPEPEILGNLVQRRDRRQIADWRAQHGVRRQVARYAVARAAIAYHPRL